MIAEVFEQLKLHEILTRAPDQQPGPVTISGHSAGGAVAMREYEQFSEEAEAGQAAGGATAPPEIARSNALREYEQFPEEAETEQAAGGATAPPEIERSNALFLFDGHIPDDQLEDFLHERLEEDRSAMEGMTETEQLEYLAAEGFFLRSYANTSGYEPAEDPRVHAAAMQGVIERWFPRLEEGEIENGNVHGFTLTVLKHWYENYKVQKDERLEVEDEEGDRQRLRTHHDTMVSTGRVPREGPHNPEYPPPAPQGTAERGHLERAVTDEAPRRADHGALQRQEDQSAEECSEPATGCEALTPEAIAGMLEQLAGGESVDGMERLRAALEHAGNADFSLVIQILDRCGQLQPLLQAMGSAPGDAAAGEERYEVPVLCFVLYNADAAQVDHDFAEANAIYNPHGVFLYPVSVRTITQAEVEEIRGYEMGEFAEDMPLNDRSQVRDGELEWNNDVTAELVARYVPRTAIAAFWAPRLTSRDRGTSYGGRAPSGGSIEDMPKLVMIPTQEPCDISFAHEIGHVLIQDGHSTRSGNLMNAVASDEACADGSQDDLTARQVARIRESTLGWIRSAAPADSGEEQ